VLGLPLRKALVDGGAALLAAISRKGGPCNVDQADSLDGNRFGVAPLPADGSFQAMPMVKAGCAEVLDKLP
jgi:hypothetical protein